MGLGNKGGSLTEPQEMRQGEERHGIRPDSAVRDSTAMRGVRC